MAYAKKENCMPESTFEERVKRQLEVSERAYNAGDPSFFNNFTEDATIFSVGSTESIIGREAYQQYLQPRFAGYTRTVKVLDRNLKIVDDKAVVTQTAQITVSGITSNVRQTMVFIDTQDGAKVQHLHTALIGTPVAQEIPTDLSSIRVLNEKVATIAGVLGVAQ
jgi:hypothetical protein